MPSNFLCFPGNRERLKLIGRTQVGITFDGYTESWACQQDPAAHGCRNGPPYDGNRQAAWRSGNWENANLSAGSSLVEPSTGDQVVRVGGGPTEHVIFSHGNFSFFDVIDGKSAMRQQHQKGHHVVFRLQPAAPNDMSSTRVLLNGKK